MSLCEMFDCFFSNTTIAIELDQRPHKSGLLNKDHFAHVHWRLHALYMACTTSCTNAYVRNALQRHKATDLPVTVMAQRRRYWIMVPKWIDSKVR